MRHKTFAVLACTLLTATASAVDDGVRGVAILTSAPTVSVRALIKCNVGNAGACAEMTLAAPLSTFTLSALSALKEEMAEVEPDALNFIAGEEKSLALEEILLQLRSNEELNTLSDKKLAIILIHSLQE